MLIEKMVAGGYGLARVANGQVLLVPYVLPGEEVLVKPDSRQPSFAHLQRVINESPQRVLPPCPYFGKCGGCQLQHCCGCQQIKLKKSIWHEQLVRSGLVFPIEKIVVYKGDHLFHYRQRIRLQTQDGQFGYFRHKSHKLIAIDQCLLADKAINELLASLGRAAPWSFLGELVRQIELFLDAASDQVVLRLFYQRKLRPRDRQELTALADLLPALKDLLVVDPDGRTFAVLDADSHLRFSLVVPDQMPLAFSLEPGGFCQVNGQANEMMVSQVLSWLGPAQGRGVLDLFCGMGNFSLPLASRGYIVTGVDQQRAAIRQARINSERNGLSCNFLRQGTAAALESLSAQKGDFSVIILDPPRAGIKKEAELVAEFRAEQIIYISCDPATLMRDLKVFRNYYNIAAISLVDMFPQTAHIETMVLLNRKLPVMKI